MGHGGFLPRIFAVTIALLVVGCSSDEPEQVKISTDGGWFREVAAESGVDFIHVSGFDGRPLFPEIMGGGVALFDADGDGDLDLYLVQSGDLRAGPDSDVANVLYENVGGGKFRQHQSHELADSGYGMGVAVGDYDGDGDVDLYVTNLGKNRLFRNEGGLQFTDVTEQAAVGGSSWSTSASFIDFDRDGDLDLYVVNYLVWSQANEKECYNSSGQVDYCHPTTYRTPAADRLYRNRGDGTFEEVSRMLGLGVAHGNGMGVIAEDFDGDGRTDIFVANDSMPNQLWMSQPDGSFLDEALLRGCALDESGTARAGMGVAVADIDEDLDPDLLVVNMDAQPDSLFRNDGMFFVDMTGEAGLSAESRRYTRFGVGFVDFNNDGFLDLFAATGKVAFSGVGGEDPYAEPNLLWQGRAGGRFERVEPDGGTVVEYVATSRAAAFGDIDGDGGVDVVVMNRDAAVHLFRNTHPARANWISLRVREGNRDAIGATLILSHGDRQIRRTVRSDGSYCAASDPRVHVGLGESDALPTVTIRWLDGQEERFEIETLYRVVDLTRGTGKALH